jgi:hypothetical protein
MNLWKGNYAKEMGFLHSTVYHIRVETWHATSLQASHSVVKQ